MTLSIFRRKKEAPPIEQSYKDKLFASVHISPARLDPEGYPKMCICELFGYNKEFLDNCCRNRCREYYNPYNCHRCWDMPYKED